MYVQDVSQCTKQKSQEANTVLCAIRKTYTRTSNTKIGSAKDAMISSEAQRNELISAPTVYANHTKTSSTNNKIFLDEKVWAQLFKKEKPL
jgi:hypothetical protein